MKSATSVFKTGVFGSLLAAALIGWGPALSADSDQAAEAEQQAREARQQEREARRQAEEEVTRQRREEMLKAIELSRIEAERAAEKARVKAEQLRAETEQLRAETDEMARQAGDERELRMLELEQVRKELSRTHRELRRASQEVARAHRDLALAEDRRVRTQLINLGDRAMLGVILGDTTDDGIKIIGLSPDGPAERAGLETGDVLVSLRGESLNKAEGRSAREVVYDIMSEVEEGEEIAVTVLREGKRWDFMVKPDKREPASWASYVRVPDSLAVIVEPDAPGPAAPPAHVVIEQIEIPPIDTTALAAEAAAMAEELQSFRAVIANGDHTGYSYEYEFGDFEFDSEAFSELGAMALSDASVWFGSPATRGIRFAELNEGLGSYFDSDRGVLVLDAPEDNPFGLQAGDVLLRIGDSEVNETSDIVRALRGYGAGDAFEISIKRNKRDQSLEAVMPENRFGFIHGDILEHRLHAAADGDIGED